MEGSRVAKTEGGGTRLPWIIAGVVAAALAGAYLGLCSWAMSRDTILPNMTVAGVDVSNMTVKQAETAIADRLAQRGKDISFTLAYEDMEESLTADQLTVDAAKSARDAWEFGRGSFFTGGPRLLGHMLGMSGEVPLALPEEEPALEGLMDRMERAVNAATEDHGYQVEGEKLVMTKGAPVITIDWETMKADARESMQKAFEKGLGGEGDPVDYRVTLLADQSETEEPDFEAIHRAVCAEPKDASLDMNTLEVTDHAVGVDFDVTALKAAYESARSGESFSIPLTITQPKVTREELEGSLFRDLLGEATSNVAGSATRKNNVKLAAAACNGVILLPGDVFSYNGTTGPRTTAKGYGAAPAYVSGATVDEVGGGVCQGSSTIYYAVLHTSLEIVERKPHRYVVTYVPIGMDATVSYGNIDFKFRNNTDYPVKIVTSSYDSGGARKLNVKIYGTNPDGHYAVPTSNTFNVVAPSVQYVADAGVPRGSLVLDREQNSYRGRSSQTYRTVYAKDGSQLERQDMGVSVYKMRPTVYHYNPADGDPSTWVNGKPPAAAVDPGTTTPVDPGTTTPVDPGTTTPADPGTTTPVDPGTTTPADPGTTTPVDPGTTTPADPGTTTPVDPGTVTPPPEQPPADPGAAA